MDKAQEKKVKSLPESMKGIFNRAYDKSKANAIKAKCLDCSMYQRDEVRLCTIKTCPIYNVRPYTRE